MLLDIWTAAGLSCFSHAFLNKCRFFAIQVIQIHIIIVQLVLDKLEADADNVGKFFIKVLQYNIATHRPHQLHCIDIIVSTS